LGRGWERENKGQHLPRLSEWECGSFGEASRRGGEFLDQEGAEWVQVKLFVGGEVRSGRLTGGGWRNPHKASRALGVKKRGCSESR